MPVIGQLQEIKVNNLLTTQKISSILMRLTTNGGLTTYEKCEFQQISMRGQSMASSSTITVGHKTVNRINYMKVDFLAWSSLNSYATDPKKYFLFEFINRSTQWP